jgi:hypothetical protein
VIFPGVNEAGAHHFRDMFFGRSFRTATERFTGFGGQFFRSGIEFSVHDGVLEDKTSWSK